MLCRTTIERSRSLIASSGIYEGSDRTSIEVVSDTEYGSCSDSDSDSESRVGKAWRCVVDAHAELICRNLNLSFALQLCLSKGVKELNLKPSLRAYEWNRVTVFTGASGYVGVF